MTPAEARARQAQEVARQREAARQRMMRQQMGTSGNVVFVPNRVARPRIFNEAKKIIQQIGNKTISGTVINGNNILSFNPIQVGLLVAFIVQITGTITNGATGTLARTPFGADNLLNNGTAAGGVLFQDFTGNNRHNCSGRALSFVEAMKYKRIPGAAVTSDSVSGYGSIIASNSAPATVATSGSTQITRVFEIPITVDNAKNMAGALWLGVNNQSTILNLTINPNSVVNSTQDPANAIYQGSAAGSTGTLSNVTVTVWQEYWTNLPEDINGNILLPEEDMRTAYMITETNSGLTFSAGNPAYWNYPTFSKLLGTYFFYDNGGTTLNPGTDISQIALQVSNYAYVRQFSPQSLSRLTRDIVTADFPQGSYGIASRSHPLDVTQYPSLQLAITPVTAPAGTYSYITTELLREIQFMAAASGVGG
jgi:hypothetical protein